MKGQVGQKLCRRTWIKEKLTCAKTTKSDQSHDLPRNRTLCVKYKKYIKYIKIKSHSKNIPKLKEHIQVYPDF